jgi:hypothetical protein
MTTKPALEKVLKGLLHTEKETRVRQEDLRKNKPFWASRLVNEENVKFNNRGIKMNGNNRHISILALNINSLNAPIKINRTAN